MSTPTYAPITVIHKRAHSYYSRQVLVPITSPPKIAMKNLRSNLINEGLLKDQWYHLNIFSLITVEIARPSPSSIQDIESNTPTTIIYLSSSHPNPELTAALRNPSHTPNTSTIHLLGRFVIPSSSYQTLLDETVGGAGTGTGTGRHREAMLVRRRTTIWGWTALLGAGISGSVVIGIIIGYATHDRNAGLTTMGVFVAVVALIEAFLIWAEGHSFL